MPRSFRGILRIGDGAIAPAFGPVLFAGEGDAAELRDQDGFAPVAVAGDVDGPVRRLCGDGRLGRKVALLEGFGIAVVVDGAEVCQGVLPTVVGDDGPGRVQGARQVVEGEEVFGLLGSRARLGTPQLSFIGTQATMQGWL